MYTFYCNLTTWKYTKGINNAYIKFLFIIMQHVIESKVVEWSTSMFQKPSKKPHFFSKTAHYGYSEKAENIVCLQKLLISLWCQSLTLFTQWRQIDQIVDFVKSHSYIICSEPITFSLSVALPSMFRKTKIVNSYLQNVTVRLNFSCH